MKSIKVLLGTLLLSGFGLVAQDNLGVSIARNNQPPHQFAMLDVTGNDKGVLVPRLTLTEKNSLEVEINATLASNPNMEIPDGLLIYVKDEQNQDDQSYYHWKVDQFVKIGGGTGEFDGKTITLRSEGLFETNPGYTCLKNLPFDGDNPAIVFESVELREGASDRVSEASITYNHPFLELKAPRGIKLTTQSWSAKIPSLGDNDFVKGNGLIVEHIRDTRLCPDDWKALDEEKAASSQTSSKTSSKTSSFSVLNNEIVEDANGSPVSSKKVGFAVTDKFSFAPTMLAEKSSVFSDKKLKTNIIDLPSNALSSILQLRPVNYNWIDPEKDQTLQAGFIAQDVELIFPHLVSEVETVSIDSEGNVLTGESYKSLNYVGLIPYTVEAVKEQENKIAVLTKQKEELTQKLNQLETESQASIQDLQAQIQELLAITQNLQAQIGAE